jgi:hypothetical protein
VQHQLISELHHHNGALDQMAAELDGIVEAIAKKAMEAH